MSISSEVLPEFREYERTVTTLVNAYVAPRARVYLVNVRDGLTAANVRAPIQVVRSDGGLMSLEAAGTNPVQTVLSGPAGGVSGASVVATRAGFDRILTFDMGGTSTDVAVCVAGRPAITRETSVGDFPVRAPAVDVASIGAGGGSIAYVAEATGALRVGPKSAGAVPGPACYGHGGTAATVTDANVVLGHLPPRLLGGSMELDADAARRAVARVADARGAGVEETARAIVDMVDEAMLGALRVVTVQRGRTPSDFALVAFGGAGGVHANALAKILGSYPVIVPEESGVLSAMGFISSDIKNEVSQTFVRSIASTTTDAVREPFESLASRARGWLDDENVDAATRTFATSSTCATRARDTRSRSSSTAPSSPLSTSGRSSARSAMRIDVSTGSCSKAAPRSSISAWWPSAVFRCPRSKRARSAASTLRPHRRGRTPSGRRRERCMPRRTTGRRSSRGWRSTATRSSSSTTRRPSSFLTIEPSSIRG